MRKWSLVPLVAAMALPVAAFADSAASVENQVEASFQKSIAAFKKHDIKGFVAICADDYEGVGMDGKKINKAQMAAQMKEHMKSTKKVNSATYDVTDVKVKGNTATGKAKFNLDVILDDAEGMMGPKGKTHRMKMEEHYNMTWKKVGGKWLVSKEIPNGTAKMSVDGKPFDPTASPPSANKK
jgi:ketosteroid isomerase-like protein